MSEIDELGLTSNQKRMLKTGRCLLSGCLVAAAGVDVSIFSARAAEVMWIGGGIPAIIGAVCVYKSFSGWKAYYDEDPDPEDLPEAITENVIPIPLHTELRSEQIAA